MKTGWKDWLAAREAKRAALRRLGLDAPSRRTVSFNASERAMVKAFGGRRIPAWAAKPVKRQGALARGT